MPTKTISTKLTIEETKYQRRVKSVELALKASGNRGVFSSTVVKVAEEIYLYLNKDTINQNPK